MRIIRTNNKSKAFTKLVSLLDAELAQRDGKDHSFYSQYNKLDTIRHTVLVYKNVLPVGCGAIKEMEAGTMEIKRMYTHPDHRKAGIASTILNELETWAKELGYKRCILETGLKQPEAIKLYEKSGYSPIPNYGQYAGIENSRCFEKLI